MVSQLITDVFESIRGVGRCTAMVQRTLYWVFHGYPNSRIMIPQFYEIGVRTIPVVALTGAFTGMVLSVQTYYQFSKLGMETMIGPVVFLAVVQQLGPVLTAVMLAGRVGASITAELGTMAVTEQIDGLKTLGLDPIKYLVLPRFLAAILLAPVLTLYSNAVGIIGGWTVSIFAYGVNSHYYWLNTLDYITTYDIFIGLVKSVFFGGAVAIISCYKGFFTSGGAEGVGRATTSSTVLSFVAILILNLFLTIVLNIFHTLFFG
ncbi:MAG: ABC transporter permease [Planctomycetota bacterium]|nr:ABC transporter permease [Planctomycetota bacterium]